MSKKLSKKVYDRGFIGKGQYGSKDIRFYHMWYGMFFRCYNTEHLKKRPTYIGCEVDERWYNFQFFCYDIKRIEGYHLFEEFTLELDKDLKSNSKVYSRDTCILLPSRINSAITIKNKKLPSSGCYGVTIDKNAKKRKYQVRTKDFHSNKNIHCGRYETLEEAAQKYREAKLEQLEVLRNYMEELGYSKDTCSKVMNVI